jgi:zinc-ribbon domain
MFCPSCGTETNDQTKFCTKCGINLRSVKEAMFDDKKSKDHFHEHQNPWGPWWMTMALRDQNKPPEEKRIDEIKGGVITSCVGISLFIFLSFLMPAISIDLDPKVAAILHAIRFVGIIPFLIGFGIIFNGMFLSKRLVELKRKEEVEALKQPLFVPETAPVHRLSESYQPSVVDFSVTESTTTKLREPAPVSANSDPD